MNNLCVGQEAMLWEPTELVILLVVLSYFCSDLVLIFQEFNFLSFFN